MKTDVTRSRNKCGLQFGTETGRSVYPVMFDDDDDNELLFLDFGGLELLQGRWGQNISYIYVTFKWRYTLNK